MDTLELRPLSEQEVRTGYVNLRKEILQDELGWTVPHVQSPTDLLDKYDSYSRPIGFFQNETLIGGVRLIISGSLEELPSHPFLVNIPLQWQPGAFAEISRLLVKIAYRKFGLMTLLIRYCLAVAKSMSVSNVIMSVRDTPKVLDSLTGIGFRVVRTGYTFYDMCIRPAGASATLQLDRRMLISATPLNSNSQE